MQRLFGPIWMTVLLATAVVFTSTYLYIALPRVLYPYDLDFAEDGSLMQACRVAQAQPVGVRAN